MFARSLQIFRRAAQASPHEWSVRSRQTLYVARMWLQARLGRAPYPLDGHRRSLGLSNVAAIRDWWSQHPTPDWLDVDRVTDLTHSMAANPEQHAALQARTHLLQQGMMQIFSRPAVPFDHPRRWHHDPILDKVAPTAFYGSIRYLDVESVGDSKHIWEPNRWAWVYALGSDHVLSKSHGVFHTFRELAIDWLRDNPYPYGINYCSALELAFRAYAMRWAMELFRQPLVHTRHMDLLDRLVHAIWVSGHHIENSLSWYFAPNTHLLGEAFLLYVIGVSLPDFAESSRWRELGLQILLREATRQFHGDGTHKELSTGYHLYATDFYLHAAWIAERMTHTEAGLDAAAFRSAQRLQQLTPASGLLPPVNDCDGGRLTWFATQALDARPSLLFARQRWPQHFHCPSSWRCLGFHQWMSSSRRSRFAAGPSMPSSDRLASSYRDSGMVTFQDDDGDYILFRAGPFGYLDAPHSHDGPLGVTVHLGGQPIVVDSGTGAYTQGEDLRNRYRMAPGKNTILMNGTGPSQPRSAFAWSRRTTASLIELEAPATAGDPCAAWHARGQHDGFHDSQGGELRVSRSVHAFPLGVVVIVDSWQAGTAVNITVPWTLSPGLSPRADEEGWQLLPESELYVLADGPAGTQSVPQSGPFSRDYGWDERTSRLTSHIQHSRAGRCITIFSRLGPVRRVPGSRKYRVIHGNTCYALEWGLNAEPRWTLHPDPSDQPSPSAESTHDPPSLPI